jgi:ketosteroid isomerase-like protein
MHIELGPSRFGLYQVKTLIYRLLMLCMILGGAAAQQKAAGDEAALKATEERWYAASVKGDAAAWNAIFADTFVSTGSDGTVQTKAEVIGDLKSGKIKYLASKADEMKVFLYGDAGIVTGRWSGKFVQSGKTTQTAERFTDTYVRQNGQWRCVATQGTTIK